ncbi:MAG: chitobiase/beta-hexosaminidase C-terminal domain-containing protein [Bacteroidales bacterium]|nr:chitobiase/beta-hexosaminidase C-terminal domain-containing protein [Bacteroidales bacterium]
MKLLPFFCTILAAPLCMAQTYDTLQYWPLTTYSEVTLSNLASDASHWTMNSKGGRYQNAVATDGELLQAQGTIIAETDGIYFESGIAAGQLLLCFNRGTSGNGIQTQAAKSITLKGLRAGQYVSFELRSSSSSNNGIAAINNLTGDYGPDTYTGPDFKKFTYRVQADGNVSWTNTAGVIYRNLTVYADITEYHGQVEAPQIAYSGAPNHEVTLSTATEGANILYTLVNHGTIQDYPVTYTGPFTLTHKVRLRAQAFKEGMMESEVTEQVIDVPLVMPFEGRPFVLDPEPLTRGAIATKTDNGYLVNWRRLIDDPRGTTFRVYRNGTLISGTNFMNTNLLDKAGTATALYEVETWSQGVLASKDTALMLDKSYWDIPLDRPAGGTTPSGNYVYVPGDCMVADVDGDQEYEIVMKWDPSTPHWSNSKMVLVNDTVDTAGQKDNSLSGYTGPVIIDCYELQPSQDEQHRKWRIQLGKNIRAGAHYTQLMVYDLDGDGKAEVACKTAPGTIDGAGNYVLLEGDDPNADYRTEVGSKKGVVIDGPEYLTVFNGETGAQIATTHFLPPRDVVSYWGDSYGNRSERYLGCVAYLGNKKTLTDGTERPVCSLVMGRGYYTSAFLWAVDFDGKELQTRWLHSSTAAGYGAFGEGAHSQSVADVDGDGYDEIIFGSCTIDHDGNLLYRTGLGHGDALHVGDFLPDRAGLEVMMVHEESSAAYGTEMRDALTGEHLSGTYAGSDIGRGLIADIDATSRGAEYWSTQSNNVYSAEGVSLSTKRPTVNFRTYWDGDLQEELTEKGAITKWTGRTSSIKTLVDMVAKYDIGVNLIKFTPCLQADIFGDWREEQIYYDDDTFSHLKIFSTTYPSDYSIPTLMHDHQYRMATVWQTSAYNQPPHLSYFLPDYVKALQEEAAAIQEIASESIDRRAKLICKEGRLYILKDNHLYDLTGSKQSK